MTYSRRPPPGPLPGYLLGDPWPRRVDLAEALRQSLPDPSDDDDAEHEPENA